MFIVTLCWSCHVMLQVYTWILQCIILMDYIFFYNVLFSKRDLAHNYVEESMKNTVPSDLYAGIICYSNALTHMIYDLHSKDN